MKAIILGIFFVSLGAFANSIPHFDLEMTSAEYQNAITSLTLHGFESKVKDKNLQEILDVGKRNLDWLTYINQHRDKDHKLSFTSKDTQTGIPMDKPRLYNPTIITNTYNALLAQLPVEITDVIINQKAFSENPPIDDKAYLEWGRKIDSSYQMASRWIMMVPYLSQLAGLKNTDIRGYYFLSQDPDIKTKLQNWGSLDPQIAETFHSYLLSMCLNSDRDEDLCNRDLDNAVKDNQALDFYNQYFQAAQDRYQGFFQLTWPRDDVKWQEDEFSVPFLDPQSADVKNFLVDNIEDEWRWPAAHWHLTLNFVTGGDHTNIVFVPGATPHVDGLGGNNITMDANSPLTEYDTQWTIRHEYGHTLGFPDCYVEYYDDSQKVMVSYQLDITNLMCSRRGQFKEVHFNELKRVYGAANQSK